MQSWLNLPLALFPTALCFSPLYLSPPIFWPRLFLVPAGGLGIWKWNSSMASLVPVRHRPNGCSETPWHCGWWGWLWSYLISQKKSCSNALHLLGFIKDRISGFHLWSTTFDCGFKQWDFNLFLKIFVTLPVNLLRAKSRVLCNFVDLAGSPVGPLSCFFAAWQASVLSDESDM